MFWSLSLPEWFAACDGYLERKGAKSAVGARMTAADLEAARDGVDEDGNLLALVQAATSSEPQ